MLGETTSDIISGSLNKRHSYGLETRSWDGFLTKVDCDSGKIINGCFVGGNNNDFPKDFWIEKDNIFITGYSNSPSSEIPKVVNQSSGRYDYFIVSLKLSFEAYLESFEAFDYFPNRIYSSKYKKGTDIRRTLTIYNIGTTTLDISIETDAKWININQKKLIIEPPYKESVCIQIIDELLDREENDGKIFIKTIKSIKEISVKILLFSKPEPKPTIQWEKESIKLDKFSIFSEKIIDLPFTITSANDFSFTLVASAPWIQLKSETGKSTDQKVSLGILGEKLTPWQNQSLRKTRFILTGISRKIGN